MTFKTGNEVKKDREKHSGTVFAVADTYIVLKEETGNHVYHPAKGKVTDYLKPIQPGEVITFESMKEKNGDQTIVWVIAWERVHKTVHSTGDAAAVAQAVVSGEKDIREGLDKKFERAPPTQEDIKWVRDYLQAKGEEFAAQLSQPKGKVPNFLTDSQKTSMRIGLYSNLNTATEILKLIYATIPKKELAGRKPYGEVIAIAKNLHDWVEVQVIGGEQEIEDPVAEKK
jgi:hypothetical protein